MHVVQTADVPPNHGRIILAMTGWTSKSRKADKEMVRAYKSMACAEFYTLLHLRPGVVVVPL